jgi:Tol biopolymer transport system component
VTPFVVYPSGGAWSSQDIILYQPVSSGSGLYRVPANGGVPAPATRLNSARKEIAHRYPQFLPDGRHFIYWVWSAQEENTGEYIGSLDPQEKVMDGPLVRTWRQACYMDPGYLLFLQGSMLMARRFDPAKLRFTGEPRAFPEHIGTDWTNTGRALISTSATGALVYQEAVQQEDRIVLRGRNGNTLRTLEAPIYSSYASLDPSERNAVFSGMNLNGVLEIWQTDLQRGVSSRLTTPQISNLNPVFSPDGQRIAFRSNRSGTFDLYAKNADGTGEDEVLVKSPNPKGRVSWSMDGRFLVYFEADPVSMRDIWVLPLEGDRKPFPFLKTPYDEDEGRLSPVRDRQGHLWMAYSSDETGSPEIYLRPFLPGATGGAAGAKVRVSARGGNSPIWRKDGRELFYLEQTKLMAVDVKLGSSPEIGVPHRLFDAPQARSSGFAVFGDGQRFLFFEPAGEPPAFRINVVLNWTAGLR